MDIYVKMTLKLR